MNGNVEFNRIIVYWFSGTGNSLLIARSFSEKMLELNKEVEMVELPAQVPKEYDKDTALTVVFPVYEQGAPQFIYRWLANFKSCEISTPVIVISTMAAFSGFVKAPLKKLLNKKGLKPLAVREIIMPSNFIVTKTAKKNETIIEQGLQAASDFASQIVAGVETWPYRPGILDLAMKISMPFIGLFEDCLSAGFRATDACVDCGLCTSLCPRDNIVKTEAGLIWGKDCTLCLRCCAICPKGAVKHRFSALSNLRYLAPGVKSTDFSKKDPV